MDTLIYITAHGSLGFVILNVLELAAGILLMIPAKKRWREYLIVIYGGFLSGLIPFWYLSENLIFTMAGCIVLIVLLGMIQDCYGKQFSLPLTFFWFRVILLLTTWVSDYYESQLTFYLLSMFLSIILSMGIPILFDLTTVKCSCIICPLFGILEVGGALLQLYRMEYDYFQKDLLSGEIIPFFLYLLKIDFWLVDDQYVYLFLVIGLVVMYLPFFWMHCKRENHEF